MTDLFAVRGEDGKKLDWPLLAWACRRTWGWEALPPVERSLRGRPFFPGAPDRHFSLSHSGGYALCALSDGPVGADIEAVRPRRERLFRAALSEGERAAFSGSWEDFFRLWTLKESWVKREDVPLYPPRLVETPPPCPHRSYAGEGWAAAVCYGGAPPGEILWLAPGELEGIAPASS